MRCSRYLVVLALLAVLPPAVLPQDTSSAGGVLEVVVHDRVSRFDPEKEWVVKFWLHRLMISALDQKIITATDLDDWQQQTKAPIRLHVRYSKRATLALPDGPVLVFDEVLLPIHSNLSSAAGPDFIYLKCDNTVQRMTKWNAWVYVKLATESGIPVDPTWLTVERGDW